MSEDFGANFITLTDDEGNEFVLEYVDALEKDGVTYMAFFPAVEDEADEESEDYGLVILKSVVETARSCWPPLTMKRNWTPYMNCLWNRFSLTRNNFPKNIPFSSFIFRNTVVK